MPAASCVVILALAMTMAVWAGADRAAGARPAQRSFPTLLDAYRHGDADAAVEEFARWSPSRIAQEVAAPAPGDDVWTAAATALLSLEADIRTGLLFKVLPGTTGQFPARTQAGLGIVHALLLKASADGNQRLLQFCRDWTILIASNVPADGQGSPAIAMLLGDVHQYFEGDSTWLLLRGAAAERVMGPYAQVDPATAGPGDRPIESMRGGYFSRPRSHDAEGLQREALKRDPGLREARLHLGHTLHVLGRDKEAQSELEQCLRDAAGASDTAVRYLAAMFLGQLHQDIGRADLARPYYEQAAVAYPTAPSVRLALGRLAIEAGREADGWAYIAGMFGDAAQSRQAGDDPWRIYPTTLYWHLPERVAAMRLGIRQ